MKQLPLPTMYCKHNHAYVSLSSIIDHFLAFGYEPDHINTVKNILISRSITNYNIVRQMCKTVLLEHSSEMSIMTLFLIFLVR